MLNPMVQAAKRFAGAKRRTAAALCGLMALALLISPVKASADSGPDLADRVVDHPIIIVQPGIGAMATGYTPAQIRKAYGIDLVSGDGTGKTIAIVDAFGSPTIEADLEEFCETFGLPYSDEVLTVHYMGSGVPAVDPGWATETALDVEWVHAIAPGANILLVEAESASGADMLAAIDYANSQDVDVVSMSFGTNEWATSSDYDSSFSHAGTTYVASTGDFGAEVNWPAVSQKVVAVGGTTLNLGSSGAYVSETAWSGSGGGTSAFISKPAYQTGFQSGTKRGVPDVAMVADPATGVQVYDSTGLPGSHWATVGGTSLSAPCWAGVYALAGETGPTWAYSLAAPATYAASYHDVTTGNNRHDGTGFDASVGYDLVTGLGTPKVNKLVVGPAAKLAFSTQPSASNVSGTAFSTQPVVTVQDSNGNTAIDSTASVTLGITTGTGTSGAVLSGTTTVSAVAGVATFSGLSIDKAGSGYTLKATSSPLTQATSSALAVAGTIAVTSPNGGESWAAGTAQNITWSSTGLSATTAMKIEISYNSGATWSTIVPSTPNTGSKSWTVAVTSSTNARVRVSVAGATPQATPGTSSADFTITGPPPPSVTVTSPNGGESWQIGTSHNITWTSVSLSATTAMKIELSRDGGTTWSAIVPTTPNSGTKAWTVTGAGTATAIVRVSVVATPTVKDVSDAVFDIPLPGVTVTSPNGGESWPIGVSRNITWTSVSLPATTAMKIELSMDSGTTWSAIVLTTPNSGTKAWKVTGPAGATVRVRVSVVATPTVKDESDADFAVPPPSVTVTSPNGGESCQIGASPNITWTTVSLPATTAMKIELSRDGGTTWSAIVPTTPNSGTKAWKVTGPAGATVRVRVSVVATPTVKDESDADFAVLPPSVTVTSPNGGESWQIGATRSITWTTVSVPSTTAMKIELSRDGGTVWSTIVPTTPNSGTKTWKVTGPGTATAIVRVSVVATPTVKDVSDAVFDIPLPSLTVTSPNGGESWQIGTTRSITWTTVSIASTTAMKIELSRDGGTVWSTIVPSTPNSGTKAWKVTGPGTATAIVRVSVVATLAVKDVSDAVFDIPLPSISVTSPNGGESWAAGTSHAITWTTVSIPSTALMKIQISRDGGATWSVSAIAASTANTGTKTWTVTGPGTVNAIIRVSVVATPSVKDESDAVFTITP